jgi:hypothetical protein
MSGLDTKYQLSIFPSFDYKSMEDNLSSMAAKGWELEHIGAFLWRFKKTAPSNKKFSVVFPGEGSEYEFLPSDKQTLLQEICSEGGWQNVIQWKHLQIFCADSHAAPMETDEAARLESVRKSMRKNFIPMWIKVLVLMLVIAFSNGFRYFGNSPYSDESTIWAMIISLYAAFIAAIGLLGYFFWLRVSEKRIAEGGTCADASWQRRLQNLLLLGFFIIFISSFVDTKMQPGGGLVLYIIVYMALALGIVSLINFLTQHLKERGWSPGANKLLSGAVTIILIFAMVIITNVIGAI